MLSSTVSVIHEIVIFTRAADNTDVEIQMSTFKWSWTRGTVNWSDHQSWWMVGSLDYMLSSGISYITMLQVGSYC